jgi:hypothetical protein
MAQIAPDQRARRIIAAAHDGLDEDIVEPLERELFHFVKNGTTASVEIQQACDLYWDAEFKHVINALFLAGSQIENASAGLGISETTLGAYRYLFFDPDKFPHNLAKTRYVKQLDCSDEFRALYELAIERGPNELIERFRIGARPRLEPETLIYDAMADMWSKFLTHRGFTVTSDTAKEALRWGEAALRTAKMVLENSREDRKNAGTVDDLRIALEIRNETKSLDDLGVEPGELVVE